MKIPGYIIKSEIGRGGMASVYLAIQESFDRPVAMKVMSPQFVADPTFSARFLREARLCARLSHPNIIPVYDVGEHDGAHYLAMEYVSGGCLKDQMQRGMRPEEAERVVREIAQALDHAADQEIIHRDVKPDNILFRKDGSAVLMDFGIARPSDTDEQVTMIGTIVGTPKYMSPEQHRGKEIDPRADLYSLGVVFFEMLTGKPPFTGGDPMAIGIKHITEPVPVLPGTVKRYQPIVKKMLAKDPEQRFQRGQDIVDALELLRQESVSAAPGQAVTAQQSAPTPTPAFMNANESLVKLEPRLRTKEIKEKAGFMSSRFVFDVYAMAEDFPQFQKLFQPLTEELMNWGQTRGKKAGRVQFKATVHPWIAGRVKDYIKRLRQSESHSFMQRIPVQVSLVGADGKPIERYVLEPESDQQTA